jgi:hypothetical protein
MLFAENLQRTLSATVGGNRWRTRTSTSTGAGGGSPEFHSFRAFLEALRIRTCFAISTRRWILCTATVVAAPSVTPVFLASSALETTVRII